MFAEDPLDTIEQHVWVTPYYEDDIRRLADTIGLDSVLFGSDWPHGEGLADPVSFANELVDFTPEEVHRIMRDNTAELVGLRRRDTPTKRSTSMTSADPARSTCRGSSASTTT